MLAWAAWLEGIAGMGTIEASQKPRGKLYSPVAGLLLVFIFPNFPATADTLEWALVQAYQNNPSLNAQRAALRATDENVPQALSGYRPKLSVTSTDGFAYSSTLSNSVNQQVFPNTVTYSNLAKDMGQRGFRRHRDRNAVQRFSDREQDAAGGKPSHGRARDLARY